MGSAPDQRRLDNRRAIVTGGASGIGRATAVVLAGLGADVLITDIDETGGSAVAEQIGGRFVTLDVGDSSAWGRVVAEHGPFDLAVLNAGVSTNSGLPPGTGAGHPLLGVTDEAYRRIMAVNLDGVVFGARAVLPGMLAAGRGDIIATASLAGLVPIALDPIYGLTKHGVVGLVRSVAEGLATTSADICVSAICPGFTDTNIVGDELRTSLDELGVELMPTDRVTDAVQRALHERVQGAQWVIWPGQEIATYEWSPPFPLHEYTTPA